MKKLLIGIIILLAINTYGKTEKPKKDLEIYAAKKDTTITVHKYHFEIKTSSETTYIHMGEYIISHGNIYKKLTEKENKKYKSNSWSVINGKKYITINIDKLFESENNKTKVSKSHTKES